MKKILKQLLFAGLLGSIGVACEKKEVLPFHETGKAPALSTSTTALAATATDSLNPVITFSWTNPEYATDSSLNRYLLQIDSAGRNFAKAFTREVIGQTSTSFTGKEINNILTSYGFNFGTAYNVDVRLISSYGNNNDRYISNTVTMKMTPYKTPPKIPVPADLIMVGDATIGGWSNPAGDPAQAIAQRFSKIDETTYAGIFFLYGGGQYLMLPVSGSWDHKYGGENKGSGTLLVDGAVPGSNTPAPDNDGLYKIVVDFQTGTYTVTPFAQQHGLPDKLVLVGGATDGGWDNNADNPQKFTRLNSVEFTITANLKKDDAYLILPEPGNWGKKFGSEDKSLPAAKQAGKLVPEGQDIPSPSEAGTYKIDVNFATGTYKLTKV